MQSHSLTSFGQELTYFKQFCQKYYRAIIIICVATVMVVTERSSSISWFPSTHYESLILYGLIPLALLISLGYRTPHSLALSIGHWRFWLPASLLYLAIAIPLVIIGTQSASINHYYQKEGFDFTAHVYTTCIYLLGWEYFFRGFLLAGLKEKFKEGAILLQLIPFTLLHLGKPDIETLSCILSGLVWGYICYRGNSFWPAYFMHLCVNLCTVLLVNV
ncbi:CPBP family intramembrane glutamic endopeptidase [Marinagarivorans cellulosilyticus]|uniref:CAAX prenyl protease 2/Lysostaphin resistance protein A-like domain-containing protein n=1 Tax=Marinagarivorans cellulosilyticus TaxID=2721545 RepID=A0AAN2BM13_9GAMM|nr:type II CAAX endopeptidase family protein [Marinagarivorans cellulosilyticus]BCD99616.1 hypothetical protein MARGE09_P3818 [Marinagarivorans cellulosilyticus]